MNATETWRTVVLLATAALPAMHGCADPDATVGDLGPTPRLIMSPDSVEQARAWYAAWIDQADVPGAEVRAAGLIGAAGRSDRPGYGRVLCRLALSSATGELIRSDGRIRIVLVARPRQPDEQVIGAWEIPAVRSGEHFRPGRLPGYQLDLYWPRTPATSTYRVVVRWDGPQSVGRQTTTISFEDTFANDRGTNPFR